MGYGVFSLTDKVVRLRNSCPSCSAISVVKMKKSVGWHCERCGARFQVPAQREYIYSSDRLPPLLQKVMENKGKCHGQS